MPNTNNKIWDGEKFNFTIENICKTISPYKDIVLPSSIEKIKFKHVDRVVDCQVNLSHIFL